MKLNILTTAAVLALTGTVMTQSAKAQFVSTNNGGAANSSDLILSFEDNQVGNSASGIPADQGSSTNYELDLGSVDQYLGATSNINIANISADLTSVYGSGFFTNSNLVLGILGVNNSGAADATNGALSNTIYVSLTNPLVPFPAESKSVEGGRAGTVGNLYSPNAGSPAPTDGATAGSFEVSTANPSGFFNINSTDGFGSGSTTTFTAAGIAPQLSLETLYYASAGGSGSKLGSSAVDNGYFTVSSGGEVEFIAATPEPSTYALMFLFWQIRRKSVSNL
jgi:hypothetical protein